MPTVSKVRLNSPGSLFSINFWLSKVGRSDGTDRVGLITDRDRNFTISGLYCIERS